MKVLGDWTFVPKRQKTGFGGIVSVGPFDVTAHCVNEIREAACDKFSSQGDDFDAHKYALVYKNGKKVDKLPDDSKPFSLREYKRFSGVETYARVRLYICKGLS